MTKNIFNQPIHPLLKPWDITDGIAGSAVADNKNTLNRVNVAKNQRVMSTTTRYAVGYCRVSTEGQREESIANQKYEIQKYADENGIEIVGWYIDHGYSGTTSNRPEFKRMLKDSGRKMFNLVLVWKLDRFARDKYVSGKAKHALKKNGVSLFSVIERIDNTPEGKMMEGMFELLSEYYVGNHARNVLSGMKQNAKSGQSNGGRCTYGYEVVPMLDENGNIKKKGHGEKERIIKTYAIHPKNSAAVKLIFKMTLDMTERKSILECLKNLGHKNSDGGDITLTLIDNILRNERYTGVYTFEHNKGKQVNYMDVETLREEGKFPKIIEKVDFEMVQKMLKTRKHRPSVNAFVDYFLTGRISCGQCGSALTGSSHFKKDKHYFYYRCKRKDSDCKIISVRKEAIESFAIAEMEKVVKCSSFVERILDQFVGFYKEKNSNNEVVKSLEIRLEDTERKIENLVGVIADSGNFSEVLQSKLDALTNDKADILKSIEAESSFKYKNFITKEAVRRSYFRVIELLKSGETADKAAIINTMLNRVIVYKNRVEVFINTLLTEDTPEDLWMSETDLTDYDMLERARAMTKAMQDEADRIFEVNINSAQSLENLHTEKAVHTDGSTDDFPSENRLGDPPATRTRDALIKSQVLYQLS